MKKNKVIRAAATSEKTPVADALAKVVGNDAAGAGQQVLNIVRRKAAGLFKSGIEPEHGTFMTDGSDPKRCGKADKADTSPSQGKVQLAEKDGKSSASVKEKIALPSGEFADPDEPAATKLTPKEKRLKRLKAALKRSAVESYFMNPDDGDAQDPADDLLHAVEERRESAQVATEADYEAEADRIRSAKKNADADKSAPPELDLVKLCGPTFKSNFKLAVTEYGISQEEFASLFESFSAISVERINAWFEGTALPNDGEFRLLRIFMGFPEAQHSFFVKGMLANKHFPSYIRYREGIHTTRRLGETLDEVLTAKTRVGLADHDRAILNAIKEAVEKSSPMEIAERLLRQEKDLNELKSYVGFLGDKFNEQGKRLTEVIQYLNERSRRFKKAAGVAAFVAMLVVGLTVAWQTGLMSRADMQNNAASSQSPVYLDQHQK